MTMTPEAQREFLSSLGLKDDPAPVVTPIETDNRTIPVTSIVFDPEDIAEFGDLTGTQRRYAADKLFAKYRAPGKNPDRNTLLWAEIGKFLTKVAKERRSGGHVKERVKATREQREIAEFIAAHGLTMEDLVAAVGGKGE